jgi:hypothetical protein
MKTIRYIAALLMLISAVWHIVHYFSISGSHGLLPLLLGILYLIIGLLLLTPKMIGVYLGLIPLVPVIMTLFAANVKNLGVATIIFMIIDLLVVICCAYLFIAKKKIN